MTIIIIPCMKNIIFLEFPMSVDLKKQNKNILKHISEAKA